MNRNRSSHKREYRGIVYENHTKKNKSVTVHMNTHSKDGLLYKENSRLYFLG